MTCLVIAFDCDVLMCLKFCFVSVHIATFILLLQYIVPRVMLISVESAHLVSWPCVEGSDRTRVDLFCSVFFHCSGFLVCIELHIFDVSL